MTTDRLHDLTDALLALRESGGTVYLYPHRGVDGDALGSCLSLFLLFRKAKIRVCFLLDESVPAKYDFLPGIETIEIYDPQSLAAHAARQSLALAVDCAAAARTGSRQTLFEKAPSVAVIDHHVLEGEPDDLQWIDPTAAATGELVYALLREFEKRLGLSMLDTDIATLLMVALITDTGRFTFSNTTSRTFLIASQLMQQPVLLRDIVHRLYDLTTAARLRLTGKIFSQMRFFHDKKIVVVCVDQDLMSQYGATDSDLDGLVGQLRNIEGVEVSFLLRELDNGNVRVNIRSGLNFDASAFARHFQGGGHARAAGTTLEDLAMQDAANMLIAKAGEWL